MVTRRLFMAPVLALAAILPMSITAQVALAAPTVCDPNSTWYDVAVTSKDILNTYAFEYVTLAPGASTSQTITHTTTYTASVTVSAGTKGSASVIFANAEVSLGFQVQAAGSTTATNSLTLSTSNTTSSTHTWVFYGATKRGVGTWKGHKCSSNGQVVTTTGSGSWGSWDANHRGVLRCDSDTSILNQYGSFSPEYKAVKSC